MQTQLAQQFAHYVAKHGLDMFAQSSFADEAYFESEQLLDDESVVPTAIAISPTVVTIEWVIVCDKLEPETRWAMLEFLNAVNSDINAFSALLSPADQDDDCDEVYFRYYELVSPQSSAENILFTYQFMREYVEMVLYPEVKAIVGF